MRQSTTLIKPENSGSLSSSVNTLQITQVSFFFYFKVFRHLTYAAINLKVFEQILMQETHIKERMLVLLP